MKLDILEIKYETSYYIHSVFCNTVLPKLQGELGDIGDIGPQGPNGEKVRYNYICLNIIANGAA